MQPEEVAEFYNRLTSLQKKQNKDTETLQAEGRSKDEEFQRKLQGLRAEYNRIEQQKDTTRGQIVSTRVI